MSKKAVFIGRFQPFHYGHEWLIRQKLDQGIPVLIMIRNIEPDAQNPFTVFETAAMIQRAFQDEDAELIIIPDIESVNWGRGVGYETNEFKPPEDIKRISATDIRDKIEAGDDSWKDFVNPKVAEFLEEYYQEK
ncbi:hypothetical protein LCGC14_2486790 [marine sediment metagenome]|uniref:Cytidyltransferase-like domain-containing protein n=1 Tax=marine sediment metagenome TaxID=412755 RepID=A0A0F9B5W6_9ZZZZ